MICSTVANIPRGYGKEYVPGCTETSDELYAQLLGSGDREIVDELLHNIDTARRLKRTEAVENCDLKKIKPPDMVSIVKHQRS